MSTNAPNPEGQSPNTGEKIIRKKGVKKITPAPQNASQIAQDIGKQSTPHDALQALAESSVGRHVEILFEGESEPKRLEIINATNEKGCVDPRTPDQPDNQEELVERSGSLFAVDKTDHSEGAERSPGASMGIAMSLMGAARNAGMNLSPEQAVDWVSEWEESEGRVFTLHEDDHGHQGSRVGCGHIDLASKEANESLYGLPSEFVQRARDYVIAKAKEGTMHVSVPILTGPHIETAVLVVNSESHTVRPQHGEEQYFRFDAVRHDQSLERLAIFLQTRESQIALTADQLKIAAEQQRNATLMLLAPGRPIYQLDLDGDTPVVILVGHVPTHPL